MKKEVVTNASSIVFIAKLNLFHLSKNIFLKILVPKQVVKEIFVKKTPETLLVKKEIGNFLIETEVKNIKELPLDRGEKEAISLCLEKNIKTFLSEDKKARRYARSLNLETIGILGILIWNLKNNKIEKKEFLKFLDSLIEKGYYISSELYSEIIKLVDSLRV